jgi:hypothetical protein
LPAGQTFIAGPWGEVGDELIKPRSLGLERGDLLIDHALLRLRRANLPIVLVVHRIALLCETNPSDPARPCLASYS